MLFDPSEYDVKPSDKNKGVDIGIMEKPVIKKHDIDTKNYFFEAGKAGKGLASKLTFNGGSFNEFVFGSAGEDQVRDILAGIIEDRKNPLSELVEIVGTEDMEPIDKNTHIAHGVHVRMSKTVNDEYMGVYSVENGYCILDLKNRIIINEFHKDKGVPKHILFKSWMEELGRNKALLLFHNYPVKLVVAMSEEAAESETQALGYGI